MFTSNRDGDFDVHIMKADGSDEKKLYDTGLDEYDQTVSPDGKMIAFASGKEVGEDEPGSVFQIVTMSISGYDVVQRTFSGSGSWNLQPQWGPKCCGRGTELWDIEYSSNDHSH